MELEQLRIKIDEIDERILALLSERAGIAEKIGQFKIDNNLSIKHTEREEEILTRLVDQNKGPLSPEYVNLIFKNIIKACRNLQKNLD